jgi:cyclohexa-1,5-dienecarbonyl-CoA hydratase
MPEKVLTESLHDGQVVRLTLNAPKANILDSQMMSGLTAALDGVRSQPCAKLVQFIGAGDHFCFGASVPEHTRENAPRMLEQFHGLFYALADLAVPTAALVSGNCLGGGMELALMCNFIFADRTARLGQPEINLGVFPPPASLLLPMKVGQAKADDIILTGRILSADEAADMGLVAQIFDNRESLLKGVDAWTEKYILPKSAMSLRHTVQAARWQFNRELRKRLDKIQEFYIDELMSTHDANEGITAFLEKRSPRWEDR